MDRDRAFFASTDEAVMGVDEQGAFVEWSPGAERIFGWTRDEVLGKHATLIAPEERKEELSHNIVRVARGETVRAWETTRIRKDGSPVEVSFTLSPVRDASGAFRGMWAVVHDLTERRRMERHLAYLERSFAVLEGITALAAQGPDTAALYREACRIAVERGGLVMAWVGRWDERTDNVTPVAHAGKEEGYLVQTNISMRTVPRGMGPTARAIREGRPIVSSDIENDPSMLPWREAALARGYRSAAAFPLRVRGRVVGSMSFYSSERDFFTPSAVRLLRGIADVLSFAIEISETRGQASRAEQRRADASAARP